MSPVRNRCFIIVLLSGLASAQNTTAAPDGFQQGLLALQADRLEEALTAFTRAEQTHPEDPRTHNFRGITLMSMGRPEEAAKEYSRAVELDPHMESAFRNLGYLEWTAHHNDKARQHLERALQLAPNDAFAAYYLARLETDDGHAPVAIRLLLPFAGKRLPWARFDLALAYLHAGNYQEAASVAQEDIRSASLPDAGKAAAQSVLGIAESKLHVENDGLDALRAATKLAPEQEELWLNLTRQEMESKRVADAIQSAQQGVEANPKSYALHLRLGAAYFAAGRYDEAEKSFRELVSAGDPLPTSTIGLAQVLLHTGRAADAAAVLVEAEHRLGAQFLIVYFEGLAQDHAGNRAEALTAFQRAVELNPSSAEAHLGVAKSSLLLGNSSKAVEEFQRVLQIDPGNVPAKRLLSRAYARSGDHAQAARVAEDLSTPESAPEANLVGDFILPEWQQPSPE